MLPSFSGGSIKARLDVTLKLAAFVNGCGLPSVTKLAMYGNYSMRGWGVGLESRDVATGDLRCISPLTYLCYS